MNIKEYQKETQRTCPDLGNKELNILHMDLGIATEIGEVLDIFKKNIAYNKELDLVHIGEEIADICWYITNKARLEGITLDEIEAWNLAKYQKEVDSLSNICSILIYFVMYIHDYNKFLGILKAITNHFELDFDKLLDNNIAKLKVRYPDKFTNEQALNRNLEKERKELEK